MFVITIKKETGIVIIKDEINLNEKATVLRCATDYLNLPIMATSKLTNPV